MTPVIFSDISIWAEETQVGMIKKMPAWRKLALMDEVNQAMRLLANAGLRMRYPMASEDELHRRLLGILFGEELACKVCGPLEQNNY